MPSHHTTGQPARRRAAKVLTTCYDGQIVAQRLLAELNADQPLSAPDAALAAELVMGVLRHRITCEHLAARFFKGRWESVRPSLRTLYALGIYQLCWLDRIPDHAAVDETVQLASNHGKGEKTTLNAVLRKIAALRGPAVEPPQEAAPSRWLPLERGRGRLFTEDIFPDPARRPLDYLVAATGHPMWLIERWHRRFKPTLCRRICDAGMRRPNLVVRANLHRISAGDLLARIQADGIGARFVRDSSAIEIDAASSVTDLAVFREGLCQPQDATAQMAVEWADLKPSETVIDYCAGAGTKSTQAAERMNKRGTVLALDIDDSKLALIAANAARLGITCLTPLRITDGQSWLSDIHRLAPSPDVLLLDVPCSNTGVLARRPEARYRAGRKSLDDLVRSQQEIIRKAMPLATEKTRVIYATCSIENEENEEQCAWLVSQFPEWRIVDQRLTLPDSDRDGGFVCRFRRD